MNKGAKWNRELEQAAERLIALALAEDCVSNDITSNTAFSTADICTVSVITREKAVLAGMRLIAQVYAHISDKVDVILQHDDCECVGESACIANVTGPARAVLAGERIVLNFIQRLCGIATITREYTVRVAGTGVDIVDTRKTTPGWRTLEKYAVRCGGGVNHRNNLSEMVMFKDNHIALSGCSLEELISVARKDNPDIAIACEADTLEQVKRLLRLDINILMLDNMRPDEMLTAVRLNTGKIELEATGGITLETVRAAAETGVRRISIGALTHSVRAIDIGMDVKKDDKKHVRTR